MGTTQRIVPGVSGEPNWDNLSQSVTSIANTVAKEQQAQQELETASEKEKVKSTNANKARVETAARKVAQLGQKHEKHLTAAIKNLIKTGGGKTKIATGKSKSLGRAGLSSAKRVSYFFGNISQSGLQRTFQEIGFGSLKGKTIQQVIDYLVVYFSDSASGMDECAATMALCQVMEKLAEGITDINVFEKKLESIAKDDTEITRLLCEFYAVYLFEHLSQRFEEKITQLKGIEVSKATFQTIREDILEQIKGLSKSKNLSQIDWKGDSGKKQEEKIFTSIIQIFE